MLLRYNLLISSFVVFLLMATSSESRRCESFEVFTEFADPSCEKTCDNYMANELTCLSDSGACFCREPNVRYKPTNECIHPVNCLQRKFARDNKKLLQCSPFEEYEKFADPSCERTCDNYMESELICLSHSGACVCRGANVRDVFTKECILPEECSRRKSERDNKGKNSETGFIDTMKNYYYDFKNRLKSRWNKYVG